MDYSDKAESLASKMNRITSKLTENLDIAEELDVTGDDIIEYVEEKTQNISLYKEDHKQLPDIVNLENMVKDFQYVRETLKETTENGRRVLNTVTLDLLAADEESRANLILSFAELNKAIATNMKLYINAYKDISSVVMNLDKIKSGEKVVQNPEVTNNNLHIHTHESISTVDLIKQLQQQNQKNQK